MNKLKLVNGIAGIMVFYFLFTVTMKLLSIDQYRINVSKLPFIGNHASMWIWSSMGVKLISSMLLCSNRTIRIGLISALVINFLFAAYICVTIFTSQYLPCSCAGITSSLSWQEQQLVSCALVALPLIALVLLYKYRYSKSSKETIIRPTV